MWFRKNARAIFFVASILAAMVLSLEKVGLQRLCPGKDSNFAWKMRRENDRPVLQMTTDAGTLTCRLRLKVAGDRGRLLSAKDGPKCTMGKTEELAVESIGDGWFDITAPLGAENELFEWVAGSRLKFTCDTQEVKELTIRNWQVIVSEGRGDTRLLANWRDTWFYVSLVLWPVSTFFGIFGVEYFVKRQPKITREKILSLVEKVGHPHPPTEARIQTMLRVWIENDPGAPDPVDAVEWPTEIKRREQISLWSRGRRRFRQLLAEIDPLGDYRRLLDPE
jgi:hypothetical protein